MSGYAKNVLNKNQIIAEGLSFVAKPLHPVDFLKKVRDVLDGKVVYS